MERATRAAPVLAHHAEGDVPVAAARGSRPRPGGSSRCLARWQREVEKQLTRKAF